MNKKLWIVYLLVSLSAADWLQYSYEFFKLKKELKYSVGIFCSEKDGIAFTHYFTAKSISTTIVLPYKKDFLKTWSNTTLSGFAVVLDGRCDFFHEMVEFASNNRLFDVTRHWLIFLDTYYTLTEFEEAAEEWKPGMFNIEEFMTEGVDDMNSNKDIVVAHNTKANAALLEELTKEEICYTQKNLATANNDTLVIIATIQALVDSEVTIVVPEGSEEDESYQLYEIHRISQFTRLLIENVGWMKNGNVTLTKKFPTEAATKYRTDYNRTLLRSMGALLDTNYFARKPELQLQSVDRWAIMGLEVFLVFEEHMNFRAVIKLADVYGWYENGSFTGLLGFIAKAQTDLLNQGLLLSVARIPALDYIDGSFKIILGMVLKEPALPQVANIFVLPFSLNVWLSLLGIVLLLILILIGQIAVLKYNITSSDVILYVTGTACQQGLELPVTTVSIRLTILVYLFSSLFLFTSYTANITALLQSPSHAIETVSDVIESNFEVAVHDQPYQRNIILDDNTTIVRSMKEKKLTPRGEKAFIKIPEGVQRIKEGLFAFQCDLTEAYREIGFVYTEHDKCGLKEILNFKGTASGPGVPKKSPFREIAKQKYMALREIGILSRVHRRWTPKIPLCEGGGGRYDSVGIVEISPIFLFMVFGIGISLLVLFVEKAVMVKFLRKQHQNEQYTSTYRNKGRKRKRNNYERSLH